MREFAGSEEGRRQDRDGAREGEGGGGGARAARRMHNNGVHFVPLGSLATCTVPLRSLLKVLMRLPRPLCDSTVNSHS